MRRDHNTALFAQVHYRRLLAGITAMVIGCSGLLPPVGNVGGEGSQAFAQSTPQGEIAPPHEVPQFLDGVEFTDVPGGPTAIEQEKTLINRCQKAGQKSIERVLYVKPSAKHSSQAILGFKRSNMSPCDAYAERTTLTMRLESRVVGKTAWHLGKKTILGVVTNKGREKVEYTLSLGQACKPGKQLEVRPRETNSTRSKVKGYDAFPYNTHTSAKPHLGEVKTVICT